jgi:hypothetical protein
MKRAIIFAVFVSFIAPTEARGGIHMAAQSSKPTEKQVAFLEQRGIQPPPTRGACTRMIEYVLHGNTTDPRTTTVDMRIANVRTHQRLWIGKRVVCRHSDPAHQLNGRTGRVQCLYARSAERVRQLQAEQRRGYIPKGIRFSAFDVTVAWDDANGLSRASSLVRCAYLTILDEGQ